MEITRKTAKENLPLLRDKHGKTLEQVSERTGIAISTLIAIEKGRVAPQAVTIHKLNRYFDAIGQ